MSEEVGPWDYTRMRVLAAEMVESLRQKRGVLHVPKEMAVFERVVAGEDVPIEEIGRAYDSLELAAAEVRRKQKAEPTGYASVLQIREGVLALVAHLQAQGESAVGGKFGRTSRELHRRYVPVLRRFAAGDSMAMDDLHMALWGILTSAVAAWDEALYRKAAGVGDRCLPLCSSGYQQTARRALAKLMQDMEGDR